MARSRVRFIERLESFVIPLIQQELIDRNVVDMAARPSATQPVHHYYDAETMQRLFRALEGSSIELAVKLAGYLGLRRSEICGLKWSHVDRREKVITGRPLSRAAWSTRPAWSLSRLTQHRSAWAKIRSLEEK